MKLIKPNRFDNFALTLGKNVKETAQGFLRIPAYTARTGIQSYKLEDGSILKEMRSEDEVFSDESMSSLRTAAVTNGHPKEMVNPDNAKELLVGHTDGVIKRVDDGQESFLGTELIITHKEAIDAIRAGKAELSNGYHVDLDFTAGEHNGEKFDAQQKNIINNHIAIVWKARGGSNVALKLDSKDAILINNDEIKINKELNKMKLTIGGKEYEVADELGNAVKAEMTSLKEKNDAVETKLTEATAKLDDATTTNEVLTAGKAKLVAKADSLQSDLDKKETPKMDEKDFGAAVKSRISVLDSGSKILDKETVAKLDEMTDLEIKTAVIKADSPKTDEEKLKDETYVNARYDMIVEKWDGSTESKKNLGKAITQKREENNDNNDEYKTPAQIREASMEQARLDSLGIKKED